MPLSTDTAGRLGATVPSAVPSSDSSPTAGGGSTKAKKWIPSFGFRKNARVPRTASAGIPTPRAPTPSPPIITAPTVSPRQEVSCQPSPTVISTTDTPEIKFPSSEAFSESAVKQPRPPPPILKDQKRGALGLFQAHKPAATKSSTVTASSSLGGATNRPVRPSLPSSPPPSWLHSPAASHGSQTPMSLGDISRIHGPPPPRCTHSQSGSDSHPSPPNSEARVPSVLVSPSSETNLNLLLEASLGQLSHKPSSTTLRAMVSAPPSGPLPDPPVTSDDITELAKKHPLIPSQMPLSSVTSATSLSSASPSPGTGGIAKLEAPNNSSQSAWKKALSALPTPSMLPLSPTPANIQLLQAEIMELQSKLYELELNAHRDQRIIRGLRWLVKKLKTLNQCHSNPASPLSALLLEAPSNRRSDPFLDSKGPLRDDAADVTSAVVWRDARVNASLRSDIAGVASFTRQCSCAPDASEPELSVPKQPSALQRTWVVRAEADRVLGRRSGSMDCSAAVDLGTGVNLSKGAGIVLGEETGRRSAESATPTSLVTPVASEIGSSGEERLHLEEERRASKALRHLSRSSALTTTDGEAMYAQNLARGQAPSLEQVITIDEAINEPLVMTQPSSKAVRQLQTS